MVDKNIRGNKINKCNLYSLSLQTCDGEKSIYASPTTSGPYFIAFELFRSDNFPSHSPTSLSLSTTYAITKTP